MKMLSSHDNHVQWLTSAVGQWIVPASSFQAAEARGADQLIGVHATKHNLSTHQEVTALSVTKVWRSRILAPHWCWETQSSVHNFNTSGVKLSEDVLITLASRYLCSSCHLHCTGGYMCKCRSRRCSGIERDYHSQNPERTHPHLAHAHSHRKMFCLCPTAKIQINLKGTMFT